MYLRASHGKIPPGRQKRYPHSPKAHKGIIVHSIASILSDDDRKELNKGQGIKTKYMTMNQLVALVAQDRMHAVAAVHGNQLSRKVVMIFRS